VFGLFHILREVQQLCDTVVFIDDEVMQTAERIDGEIGDSDKKLLYNN
jgi:ABC-type multidrug transport system ATPase subunit